MPDERIKDLAVTAALPASDDFEVLDGQTNGTRKLPAAWRMVAMATRQPLLGLALSDGATPNRRIEWTMGAAGNVAGSALSEVGHVFRVPTSNPTGGAYIFGYTFVGGGVEMGSNANGLIAYISTAGGLRLDQIAATATPDRRRFEYAAFRADYSGQVVRLDFIIQPGTTAPMVFINGQDRSSLFTATTTGSPPNWMDASMNTAVRYAAAQWTAGEFRPGTPINRALTAAEIAQMVQTGALLPVDRLGGSMVAAYTSNFSAGVDSWGFVCGTISGNQDAVSDGFTTKDDCMLFWADGTAANSHYTFRATFGSLAIGNRVRLRGSFYIPSGQSNVNGVSISPQSGTAIYTSSAVGAWTDFDVSFVLTPAVRLDFFQTKNGSITFTGANSASDDRIYLHGVTLTPLGALLQSEITRTAQVLDHGPNRIRGIMTAGIRPLSDRDPVGIRVSITATGNILGLGAADPLWFEPALIKRIRVKPTASASTTTTVRLNTSGGTTVGTLTTTTLNQWVDLPFSAGTAFEVNSGNKLHITTTAALDFDIEWSRR